MTSPTACDPGRGESWTRRETTVALGIFALALALRLVHLGSIADLPTFEYLIADAKVYDAWGQRLAAGDWLGREAFYQAPAYPYLLGLIYAVFGHDLEWTHRLMMGLGALSCVLAFATTRLLFGFGAALAAGVLLAIYPVAIFYDGQIGKTGLGLFLVSATLFALVRLQLRPARRAAALAGVALGLLCLTRENALIFAPIIPCWILWRFAGEGGRRRALGLAAVFALGLALVLGPVALRNVVVGGSLAVTTSQLGPNFYIGNNPEATGLYAPLVPGRHVPAFESPDASRLAEAALGRDLTRGEVSDYWLGRGLDFVRGDPGGWARLMLRKVLLTWNTLEIPDTEDVYVSAEWSPLLRALLPLFDFGALAALAIVGMALAWERRRDTALFYLMVAAYTGAVAIFMVFGRMRFPLVPLLVPFAGYALVAVPRAWKEGRLGALGVAVSAGLVTSVVVNLPLLDAAQMHATGLTNLGGIMLREGHPAEAQRYLVRAETLYPDHPDLQYALATLRSVQGRPDEAEAHVRYMLRMADGDYRGHALLASILARKGESEAAAEHRRRAFELDPSGGVAAKAAFTRPERPASASP
ncbi:MAG: glycosyltransferase family 39 protein [Myxococcota bacterium]|jgi:tetratricopeptide (TPR) repeat protein